MDKIIGLGNALVDALAIIEDDNILTEMQLPKGSMTLIDEDKFLKISEYFSRMETHLANGDRIGYWRLCRKCNSWYGMPWCGNRIHW